MIYIANIKKSKIQETDRFTRKEFITEAHVVDAINETEVKEKIQAYYNSLTVVGTTYDIDYQSIYPLL
jgi:hypothetical protein